MDESIEQPQEPRLPAERVPASPEPASEARPVEIGGRKEGLEPTRYGDWEKAGRCIDF